MADKIRIYQVISNLLINAIKFTQKNIAVVAAALIIVVIKRITILL